MRRSRRAAVLAAGSSGGGRRRRLGVAYELRSGGGETLLHGEESEVVRAPRNRLAPRYINIAITRYNDNVGATEKQQHNLTQKKIKRKIKETNADIEQIDERKRPVTVAPSGVVPPHS